MASVVLFSAAALVAGLGALLAARWVQLVLRYQLSKHHFEKLPALPGSIPLTSLFDPKRGMDLFLDGVRKASGEQHRFPKLLNMGPFADGASYIGVTDLDAIKLMMYDTETFVKHPATYDALSTFLGDGLVNSSGDLWLRERRLLTPLFHFQSLKDMFPHILHHCCIMSEKLAKLEGQEVNAVEFFNLVAFGVIIDSAFGGDFDVEWMHKTFNELLLSFSNFMLVRLSCGNSPLLRYVWPVTKYYRKVDDIRVAAQQLIEKRRREGVSKPDLLSAMMKVHDEQTGQPIPDKLIIDEAATFLFAGNDTTTNLVSWAAMLLAQNPSAQQTLFEEVQRVVGDEAMRFEHLAQLRYCRAVVDETLRLRPPVPGFLDRLVTKDVELCGMRIPKGTAVAPLMWCNHLSSEFFDEPDAFKPERFLDDSKPVQSINPFIFLPFSAGPRNCIGQKLAVQEAMAILVHVVKGFQIEQPKSNKVEAAFVGTMTPVGLRLIFTRRS